MPWKVYKETRDGKAQYCLHKHTSGKKGDLVPGGCHDTPDEARKHQAALYVSENKEFDPFDMIIEEEKEIYPEYPAPSAGVATSFAELEAQREYQEKLHDIDELMSDFQSLVGNIIYTPEAALENDKVAALSNVFDEFKERLNKEPEKKEKGGWIKRIKNTIKGALEPSAPKQSNYMTVWKEEDGSYSWLTTYSNKFIDNDYPPDVISSDAHKKFVEYVDKGTIPLPELWIWHVPEWKVGYSTAVAYDDVGFPVAIGKFDDDCKEIAEWMSTQPDFGVSHGMWRNSIKRDPDDESVIVEYETYEISPLPRSRAANKLADFVVLSKEKEDNMSIPEEKREELLKRGLPEGILSALEERNKANADKALEDGLKSKEETEDTPTENQPVPDNKEEETTEAPPTDEVPVETAPPETPVVPDTTQFPTREEVAEAIASVVAPIINDIKEAVLALQTQVKEMQASDEERIKELISTTPRDSLSTLMAQRLVDRSSKSQSTVLPKGDDLLRLKPKETKNDNGVRTGIKFVDKMIVPSQEE